MATSLLALGACTAPTGDADPADEVEPEGVDDNEPDSPLSVRISGDEVDFEPTDVYCKVGGGELRHVIAKTNNRPPLLEVTPGEFAMLKIHQKGAPEKTNSPTGIEYTTEGLTFTDTQVGSATLNGYLECTKVEGQ